MAYNGVNWVNDGPPAINAANLEIMDNGIKDNDQNLTSFMSNFNIVENNNLLNPNTWEVGVILTSSGAEDENPNYSTSDFINVEGITNLGWYYQNPSTGNIAMYKNAAHICCYDQDKNYLSGSHDNTKSGTYTVPNGAVFMRYSCYNNDISKENMMVSNIDDGQPTQYIPYGATVSFKMSDYVTLDDLADLPFLDGESLSANTDLNSLADGVYYASNEIGATLINSPIDVNLKIIQFTRYGSNKIQIIFGGNLSMWQRSQSGATWRSWYQIGDHLRYLEIAPDGGSTPSPKYGNELSPSISEYTGNGATYDNGWVFTADNQTISTSINVEADEMYLIELSVSNPYTGSDENGVPAYLDVSLGSDTVRMFAANDAYWVLSLSPNATGSATFEIESINHWTGKITNVSIKKVTEYAKNMMTLFNQEVRFVSGSNFNIGGYTKFVKGVNNVGIGPYAQRDLTTARWNTALGHSAQKILRNGTGNTAIGASAQGAYNNTENAGSYNNCVGNATQMRITTGNWNNAFGNEAQLYLSTGCNNTNIGRRSGSAMTTGNYNTHLGMWTGFIGADPNPENPDNRNTISASRQTLVGAKARQIDHQSDDLVCVGYGTLGDERAVAIGSGAKAQGENSIAIGYGVETDDDNQVKIGTSNHSIILADKRIIFNQDGTVTWDPLS